MRTLLLFSLLILGMISCTPAGSKWTTEGGSGNTPYLPYINDKGDTIDFCMFFPVKGSGIWIGTNRNKCRTVTNYTYSQGKTTESIVLIEDNAPEVKIIKGNILSETDDIIVIQKEK